MSAQNLSAQTSASVPSQSPSESGTSTPASAYTTATSAPGTPGRAPLTLTQALLALTPIEPTSPATGSILANSTTSLPSVFTSESRATSAGPDSALPDLIPHPLTSDTSSDTESEYEQAMEYRTVHIRRRSSAATRRHNSTSESTRRASQRSATTSPLTRFRGLSAMEPVDDEAVLEEEDGNIDEKKENAAENAPLEENSLGLGGMITELSRHVSVEAAAGPVALYAPRSRTGSVSTVRSTRTRRPSNRRPSTSRVSFPDTVVEHDAARKSAKPDLPRIDSEKTLAPGIESDDEHDVHRLAKSKSRESRASVSGARPSGDASDDGGKFSDGEDAEAQAQAAQEAAMNTIVKGMTKTRKILLGTAMMLTVLVSSMSSNAVILTIPSLAADLGVGQLEAQWVASAYSLAFGCGLLFSGRLADIYGRKLLFLLGLSCAFVFCIISGFMRTLVGICVVRAIAGLGLAIATPAGFGILGVTFREEPERTIAFSCFGLGNPVGASIGMLVGGGVSGSSRQGWQYLYFVLAGLCVIPLALGFWVIPKEPKRPAHLAPVDKRVDWLGGFLITAALCLFTFSITQSGVAPRGWQTPYIPTLLAISIVLFVAFGLWERHVERRTTLPPVAKLSMFSRDGWKMTYVLLTAFCPFVAIAGWVYLVSLFYQEYKLMTPLGNAIHTLPASLCGTVAALAVMYIVPRMRAPYVLMIGGFLSGTACLIFAAVPADAPYWSGQFVAMLCLPFGADLTTGIGSILMSNLCEDDEQSVGGALFQTATQIASALGICISSLVVANIAEQKNNYLTGLQHGFGMCTAWAWVVVLIATCTNLRKMGLAKDVGSGRAIH